MEDCLFCKIASNKLPSEKVFETDNLLVINDINPQAPVHLLIIPKRHANIPDDLLPAELLDMFKLSEQMARKFKVDKSGYRLLFNIGKDANQEIDHVHLHLLGGKQAQQMY